MVDTLKLSRGMVHICKDSAELGDASAREFVKVVKTAIETVGRCTIALSGGHTPHILYERVLKDDLCAAVDWSKVHFFVGDERCVPLDSSDNNFGNAQRQFLSKLNLPAENLHPTQGQDRDPAACAKQYEQELINFFGLSAGEFPRFDMIHLGMGPDGHCASLFPGTDAVKETSRLVVANYVVKLDSNRITFTFPVINSAAHVMLMLEGAEKAAVLGQVLQSEGAITAYPVDRLQPYSGEVSWFIDTAAAGDMKVRS